MYAVVGCSNCQALWIVDGRPETTRCPRCGTRQQFDRLKQFVRTEDRDEAREVRAAMLASAQNREEAYEALDSVAEMETHLDSAGVDDTTYLSELGLDPETVASAGEPQKPNSLNRRDQVLAAIDTLQEPTESAVIEYTRDRGFPADAVREALTKLSRDGTIIEGPSGYRRL